MQGTGVALQMRRERRQGWEITFTQKSNTALHSINPKNPRPHEKSTPPRNGNIRRAEFWRLPDKQDGIRQRQFGRPRRLLQV